MTIDQHPKTQNSFEFKLSKDVFEKAAKNGNLSCMMWLKENGCSWDERTFAEAALNGDLGNMKWLRENGCPWDTRTFAAAALNGNLENMKWLKDNHCPWDARTLFLSAKNGKVSVDGINWLKECVYSRGIIEGLTGKHTIASENGATKKHKNEN